MRRAVTLLLLLIGLPIAVNAQPPSTPRLPLVVTDKAAIDEWMQAMYGRGFDPKESSETAFLLSLNETEWAGRFRFRQRCALCHAYQPNMMGTPGHGPNPLGPVLTRRSVEGREEAVRRRIMEGSPRMPAFKYAVDSTMVDAIIAYLKKVDEAP